MASNAAPRADKVGEHRTAFDKNRKRIYAAQTTCGICGRPVDKTIHYPHPLSPTIDHIIPINRGGHPSDIDNLQLAHLTCNRQKSDRLQRETAAAPEVESVISNRVLPLSMDWSSYVAK